MAQAADFDDAVAKSRILDIEKLPNDELLGIYGLYKQVTVVRFFPRLLHVVPETICSMFAPLVQLLSPRSCFSAVLLTPRFLLRCCASTRCTYLGRHQH